MDKKYSIGFDLGTTYSCVAYSKDGKAEVIANPEGRKTTPSVVAYVNKERIVGAQAFTQAESSPQNVIYDSKRLIGQLYEADSVQEDKVKWPFQVRKGANGRPVIICPSDEGNQQISPEEVGADILRELKVYAENFLEIDITDCIITCPASFDDTQRKATIHAAKIAGLNCLRLVNEPTAAAVAYGVTKEAKGTVLIYDFGGGTFDATILSIEDGVYEVSATGGDPHCGGKDLDNILIEFIMSQFNLKRTTNSVDINKPEHQEAKKKLAKAVEDAKISLATTTQTKLFIGSFVKVSQQGSGRYSDLSLTLSRATLEKLAKPLTEKSLKMTLDLLKDNNVAISDLNKVVLVGGFTKMPLLKEQLKKTFGDKVSLGINPDEAVALGAAMMAEVLSNEAEVKGLPKLLLDVTPLALGIELENGTMSKIIQKNTPYPTLMQEKYTTSHDNQMSVKIVVYQGNRDFARDNKKLGFFKLEGIPKMAKGVPDICVSFSVCEDGVLSVTAIEKSSGTNKQLIISKDKIGGLTETELGRMVRDGERYAEEDRKKKQILLEKDKLERLMTECEDESLANEKLSEMLKETSDWLKSDTDKEVDDFIERGRKLEDLR